MLHTGGPCSRKALQRLLDTQAAGLAQVGADHKAGAVEACMRRRTKVRGLTEGEAESCSPHACDVTDRQGRHAAAASSNARRQAFDPSLSTAEPATQHAGLSSLRHRRGRPAQVRQPERQEDRQERGGGRREAGRHAPYAQWIAMCCSGCCAQKLFAIRSTSAIVSRVGSTLAISCRGAGDVHAACR